MINQLPTLTLLFGLLFSWSALSFAESIEQQIYKLVEQKKFNDARNIVLKQLNLKPGDPQLRYHLARISAWQGDYPSSIARYDELLAEDPENTDYLLGKSQVMFWEGNTQQAIKIADQARTLSPGNRFAWELSITYRNQLRSADSVNTRNELVLLAREKFPAYSWPELIQVKPPKKRPLFIEAGLTYDQLDNNYDNWHSLYLLMKKEFAVKKRFSAKITSLEKFSITDKELELGLSMPLNPNWDVNLVTTYSPGHKLQPASSFYAQPVYHINDKTSIAASWKQSTYPDFDTTVYTTTLEHYFSNMRLEWTGYASKLKGGAINTGFYQTHKIALDYFYAEKNRVGISYSNGDEIEYTGFNNFMVSNVKGFTIKGTHWFNQDFAFVYDLHQFQQGEFYTRDGFLAGVRYRI